MKTIKFALFALFLSLVSVAQAQEAQAQGQVDLNALVASVGSEPDSTAAQVEAAVSANPEQVHEIVNVLLANYPDLAGEIIFGAIAGLPSANEEMVSRVVARAIAFRPGLASEIALGARRATTGMEGVINSAAVLALRQVASNPRAVGLVPGQREASAIPGVFVDGTLLSPAR